MDQNLQIQRKILKAIQKLGKIITENQNKDQYKAEEEAKQILIGHLETVRATVDDSYEEPDEPRSLDKEDQNDRKVIAVINKILNQFTSSLTENDDDDSENEEDDDSETEGEEENLADDEESSG